MTGIIWHLADQELRRDSVASSRRAVSKAARSRRMLEEADALVCPVTTDLLAPEGPPEPRRPDVPEAGVEVEPE